MFKVKKKQGTDISRSFDGLNNPQNLANSFKFAKAGGMIAQAALSLTFSPIHTVDYYINLADQYIEHGADEICIKDMAGIGRPVSVGKIVAGIKKRHPDIIVQYHGHSTPGFSVASSLEAAKNGADIIDVGMEPLSWGTGHADLLTIHAMLKDAGFRVKDFDYKAYMETRSLSQEFMNDFLGYYIDPMNRKMNSLLIGPGLPGGMMGSLMADLENNLKSINKWLTKRDKPEITQEDLLIKLFEEVEYVWPKLGYPCLVTPYSQYVKNVALMNVLQMIKGKERWSMIDENTWGMLSGRSGQLAGPVSEELLSLARNQNREFYQGNPQDLYPDELELFAAKMDQKGWDYGEDDEELMEYAMHPTQYEDFKSGKAKEKFWAELAQKKEAANAKTMVTASAPVKTTVTAYQPKVLNLNINGEQYKVSVSYDENKEDIVSQTQPVPLATPHSLTASKSGNGKTNSGSLESITAPLEGKFFLTKESSEIPVKVGDQIKKGDTVAYIEAMKVINAVAADKSGTVVEIVARHGEEIEEDDVIIMIQ